MTTNTPLHDDPAMRRVQQTINRSAGQHLRAIRKPVESEGTRSARAILGESITSEPLLLNRLHRVDTLRDLPADTTGVAIGHAALPVDYATTRAQEAQHASELPDESALGMRIVVATMTIFGAVIGYAIWSALQ